MGPKSTERPEGPGPGRPGRRHRLRFRLAARSGLPARLLQRRRPRRPGAAAPHHGGYARRGPHGLRPRASPLGRRGLGSGGVA
ncbi:hypothetical protein ADK38_24615, partial [Streptomyces varsoviensis]